MTDQPRVPAGDPNGGQFSGRSRAETGTSLSRRNSVSLHPDGSMTATHGAGAKVRVFTGEDGALVVELDTTDLPAGHQVRMTLNDGDLFDGDPEVDEAPGPRLPGMDRVRARREAVVRDFIDSQDDIPEAAVGWRVDILNGRDGARMSRLVDLVDAHDVTVRTLDSDADPEAHAAVAALVEYVDPDVQDGYYATLPRIAAPE